MFQTMIRVSKMFLNTVDSLANTAASAPSAATNGILVPITMRGEYSHLLFCKTNTCNATLWGMTTQNNWTALEGYVLTGTTDESQLTRALGSYTRAYIQITGLGATALGLNAHIGWTEG